MSKTIDPDGLDGLPELAKEDGQQPAQVRVGDPAAVDPTNFDDEDTTNVRPGPSKPADWSDDPTSPGIPMEAATTRQLAQVRTPPEDSEDSSIQLMIEPTRAQLRMSPDPQVSARMQLEPPKPQPPPIETFDEDGEDGIDSGGGKGPLIAAAVVLLGLVGFGVAQMGGGDPAPATASTSTAPVASAEPIATPPAPPEPTAVDAASVAADDAGDAVADAAGAATDDDAAAQAAADLLAAAEAQATADAQAASEAKAKADADAQAKANADAAVQADADAAAAARAKAKADADAAAAAEAEAKARDDAKAKADARAKADADAKAKADAEARRKAAASRGGGSAAPLSFEYDDATPMVVSASQLDSLLAQLRQAETMVVTGHTCNLGDPNYNVHLGYERARAVRDLLVEAGIGKWRIKVESSGDSSPLTSNETAAGRQQNRRVEIRIE